MAVDAQTAFSVLPPGLSKDLLDAFSEVVLNYEQHRWEPSELNGGKLCEATYTIVEGFLDGGTFKDRANKPSNMVAACQSLEKSYPATSPRSPRIQIPRVLMALYEIRNNRGVGHAGGDVNPNQMDATAVLYLSKWLMAELVRLLHTVTTQEASSLVEELVERQIALVWQMGDKRRVLDPTVNQKQQVLILLAGTTSASEAEMISWMEHKNKGNLRSKVLRPLHRQRMIEFDENDSTLRLLPPGVAAAESLIRKLSNVKLP